MKEKEFHFSNVLISISAVSAEEAYDKLTDALASINAEWETDTYRIDIEKEERSTEELFSSDRLPTPPAKPCAKCGFYPGSHDYSSLGHEHTTECQGDGGDRRPYVLPNGFFCGCAECHDGQRLIDVGAFYG